MNISIVTTVYNLAEYVQEFHARTTKAVSQLTDSYEIIFVNDGSPDDAADRIAALAAEDEHVVLVNLSRNFGHHHAVMAGMEMARGDRVFLIDVDLEESPEWITDFHAVMDEGNWDVVYGAQEQRKGNFFERMSGTMFYKLFNLLSGINIPESACIARLMRREYVDAVLRMKDKNLYFPGTFAWVGYRQTSVTVTKTLRETESTYTLFRKIQLMGNAISSFSSQPLLFIFILGMIFSAGAGLCGIFIVLRKLLGVPFDLGWPSLIVSIWFLSGIIIMFIGIVGLYLGKVFNEIKDRPNYLIRDVIRKE